MMRSLCRPEGAGTGSRRGCEVRISSSIFWQKQMRTRSHRQRDSCPTEEPRRAFYVTCTAFPHLQSRQPPMQPKLLTQEGSREQFVGPDSAFSSPALFECQEPHRTKAGRTRKHVRRSAPVDDRLAPLSLWVQISSGLFLPLRRCFPFGNQARGVNAFKYPTQLSRGAGETATSVGGTDARAVKLAQPLALCL